MTHPVTVTESAATEALRLLERENYPDSGGLRLYIQNGGCSGLSYGMRFEQESDDGDDVSNQHGLNVIIDAASAKYLSGTVVDFRDGLAGAVGWHFENPNETASCGCGESFRT